MSFETAFVFALIGVAALLMASNRVRFDIVALLVVLALILSGVLSVGEALAGFGSSVVILVACLMVVGEMLDRTGVANAIGDWILARGGSETRLLIVIMVAAAVLSAVMSSTAVVAIFIPIIMRVAAESQINASRLLMPMSYAALISGMLTLIATPPNLVIHEELRRAGYDGFGFFTFTLVGIAVLFAAIGYILILGRRLLPGNEDEGRDARAPRTIRELAEDFEVRPEFARIGPDSPLAGRTLAESELGSRYGARVLAITRQRRGRRVAEIASPQPTTELRAGDTLVFVVGEERTNHTLRDEQRLHPHSVSGRELKHWRWELGAATILIHPESSLVGKSLRGVEFRTRYGVHVLGVRRDRKTVTDHEDMKLAVADGLLVAGPWSRIRRLAADHHDFILVETPAEQAQVVPAYRRMPVALIILVGMVLLTLFDVVPLVAAVIMAALAAVLSRCLTADDSYRAIHWSSLVLIAGMLPLADALAKTGGTQLIVDGLIDGVGESGPLPMLTVIFFLTAGLSLVLANTAAAVLMAPIAIVAAETIDVSPYPFAVTVVIAASAAFATPVASPVVTLVVEPGRYRFVDYVKVGVPLLFITYVITLLLVPLLFPFTAA